MKIVVSHEEAYAFAYATRGRPEVPRRVTLTHADLRDALSSVAGIMAAADLLAAAGVVAPKAGAPGSLYSQGTTAAQGAGLHHVLVASGRSRSRNANRVVVRHVSSGPAPPDGFVHAGDGVYVSSPELAWLQVASHLTLVQAVLAGCALCASYRIDAETGNLIPSAPATTPAALAAAVAACPGAYGAAKARRALRYVAAGVESPAELATYVLVCLPPALGGIGAPLATLNYTISVATPAALSLVDRPDRHTFRVDMGWPALHRAVEYLGKHHGTQVDADRERMNAMVALGERVLQVTYADLANPVKLARLTRQVCALLGMAPPAETPTFLVARDALLRELFGALAWRL